MSQDFYPSGYSMGEDWSAQWSQQQPSPQQFTTQTTAPSQTYDPSQYANTQYVTSQYDTSQYAAGQQYGDQQQSFYSTPSPQQDFYSPSNQNYNNSNAAQQPVNDNSFYTGGSGASASGGSSFYNPNMGTMGSTGAGQHTSDSFEDEPPLMEELGIDLQQIYQTTMTVLNPSKPAATTLMDDPDLSGPLMFCLGFGSLLLLSGKIHFGYIYGVALVGAVAMYSLLNLMSVNGVSVSVTVSVLGYCMLPMCVLAGLAALISLKGAFGIVLSGLTVSWAAFASSKLFVSVLAMYDQQPLVAYPCAIMYGIFAVLTVF